MKITHWILGLLMFSALMITGCNKQLAPGDYDAADVGKIKKVVPGVIVSMRPVRLHSKSEMSSQTKDAIEEGAGINKSHGFEYVIKLNSGNIISVVQAENIKLKVKQRILIIYGRNTRVVPDNGSDNF